jgi:hypothetical protein
MKKFILIIVLLIISVASFSQITERQLRDGVVRSKDNGVLTNFELTFNEPRQKYSLSVTSDISLTLAASGNKDESYIFIYATGDGSHTLSFPSDWIIKSGTYNTNVIQRIFIEYVETPTPVVFVTIEPIIGVVIPTLNTAQIAGGTDDIN